MSNNTICNGTWLFIANNFKYKFIEDLYFIFIFLSTTNYLGAAGFVDRKLFEY